MGDLPEQALTERLHKPVDFRCPGRQSGAKHAETVR